MSIVNRLINSNNKASETTRHNTKVLEVLGLRPEAVPIQPCIQVQEQKPLEVKSDVVPESSIRDEYKDDYNIINAHNKIVEWFEYEKNILIKDKKNQVTELQNETCSTILEKKENMRRVKILNDEIKIVEMDTKIINYKKDIFQVVSEYNKEYCKPLFISNDADSQEDINLRKENRIRLIERFASIASRHFSITLTRNILYTSNCPECSQDYREIGSIENGMYVCECGWNSNISSSIKECMSSSRLAGPTKNYQDEENFRKLLLSFSDAQGIKYSPVLLSELDTHFAEIHGGKYHRDKIKLMPLDPKGIKPGTSVKIMRQALKATDNQKFYNNCYKICQDYWGWVLPNLCNLEDKIMEDRKLVMTEFKLIEGDEKSAMNGNVLLYKLLRRNGFPCEQEDVKMISTSNIYINYMRTYECIRLRLGWDDA